MTLSLLTRTTTRLNSSIYSLHQRLHQKNLNRLLSSATKLPDPEPNATPNSTPNPNPNPNPNPKQDEPQNTIPTENEEVKTTSLNHERGKHILSISDLSKSIYLRPIKQQIQSIRSKLSEELGQLPTRLSQVTGYGDIDRLKSLVSEKEADLRASRTAALQAKTNFNQAAQCRAESVREVNDLLARKASWSDQDLARFTMLVRTDHANEQAESEAKKLLELSESQVDHQFTSMMQAILTRYHEEQIWSDKIRALSTTFSLSITVINVLVFLAAIVLVEPYKRSKVVSEVEERIKARDTNNSEILDRALSVAVDRLSTTEKELTELVLALQPPVPQPRPSSSSRPLLEEVDDQQETWLAEEVEKEMETEGPARIEDEERLSLPATEEHGSNDDAPQASWADRIYRLNMIADRDRQSQIDQALVKAIGVGTVAGIIIMTSFQLLSR